MKNIVFVLLLLSVFTVEAQEFRIEGQALETDQKVTLKYFSPEDLKYVPLETIQLNGSQTFSFSTDFNGANLYELSFDEKHFVHLLVAVVHKYLYIYLRHITLYYLLLDWGGLASRKPEYDFCAHLMQVMNL